MAEEFLVEVSDRDLDIAVNLCDEFFFGANGVAQHWNNVVPLSSNEESEYESESEEPKEPPLNKSTQKAVDNFQSELKFHSCKSKTKGHKQCEDISYQQLVFIRKLYRDLTPAGRRHFLSAHIILSEPKRRRSTGIRAKTYTGTYLLPKSKFSSVIVCQKKFVTTLGYTSNKVIKSWFKNLDDVGAISRVHERQGRPKIDRGVVMEHIESFQPQISHYHRSNAANVRYLPRYLTINEMYLDFVTKHGGKSKNLHTYMKQCAFIYLKFYYRLLFDISVSVSPTY